MSATKYSLTVQSTLNILYQVKYYVGQKDSPQDWKCQPNKWLSSKEEIHEVLVGWFSVTLGSALSAALATWVVNGGYTSLYYSPGQYGLVWALVEGPLVFIVTVSPRPPLPSLDNILLLAGLHHLLASQSLPHALPLQGNL